MNALILITGGCRSGKSAFAQKLAENISGERIFIATSPSLDAEMAERIRRHQQERLNRGWQTVEELCDPAREIATARSGTTIVLDCLTLWINNLVFAAENSGAGLTEDDMTRHADELAQVGCNHTGTVIMVTNEVGLGIVPDNKLARHYRDLVGRCNQTIAAHADQVFLVSCGIPLQLKKNKD